MINKYKDHPNITKIKDLGVNKTYFEFSEATMEDINKFIRKLNPNKATGPDRITLKAVKAFANVALLNIYCK